MNRIVRNALIMIAAATTAAAARYYYHRGERQAVFPTPPSMTAAPAPDAAARLLALQLPDSSGRMQPLSQWRGQVLVVNFWATWCLPCREEMPEFSRISLKYAGKGVQFVGISIDPADKVIEFQREFPVPYPLLIASPEQMRISGDLGNRAQALPFTAILDRRGQLHYVKVGRLHGPDLEKTLATALR